MCFLNQAQYQGCGHIKFTYALCRVALYFRYSYDQVIECFGNRGSKVKYPNNGDTIISGHCDTNFCKFFAYGTLCGICGTRIPAKGLVRDGWEDFIGHVYIETGVSSETLPPSFAGHLYNDATGWYERSFGASESDYSPLEHKPHSSVGIGNQYEENFPNRFPPPADEETDDFSLSDQQKSLLTEVRRKWVQHAGMMPEGMSNGWETFAFTLKKNLERNRRKFSLKGKGVNK